MVSGREPHRHSQWEDRGWCRGVSEGRAPREGQSGETLKRGCLKLKAQPTEAERKEERQGSGSSMQEPSVPFGMNLNLDGGEVKAADGKVEGRVLFARSLDPIKQVTSQN